jgi:hypothetical protein
MPVWLNPNELQVGATDPVVVSGLTQAQQRLVTLLMRGIPTAALPSVAEELGVEHPGELIERLGPALLQDRPAIAIDREYIEQNFAEICRAQATFGVEGAQVIARRNYASVFIEESRTRPLLGRALTTSGVGILLDEKSKVTALMSADVAITVDHSTHKPRNHRRWIALGVPQVAILFDQTGVQISPLIEVGKTPCLTCLQMNRADNQIAIDSQLLFSTQKFDDAVSEHFAVAIATQTALRRIDQSADFALAEFHRTGYRLDAATGTIHELHWQFASGCLCHQKLGDE